MFGITHLYVIQTIWRTRRVLYRHNLIANTSILLLKMCVYCYEIVRYYLLDITALSELETQAFRYTRNNIC